MDEREKAAESDDNMEKSQESAEIRKRMHDAIDRRDFGQVQKCLEEATHLRQWLKPGSEESAMYTALQKGAFKIYALLVHNKCTLSDKMREDEEEIFGTLREMERREYRYQLISVVHRYLPIPYIMCKSSSKASYDGFETGVKELYEKLYSIAIVKTILQVVATSWYLEVIFDFDSEHVGCMLGPKHRTAYGMTLPGADQVYIGANRDSDELLGTIAHEFCHLALYLVYENSGKPYKHDDTKNQRRYQRILNETKKKHKTEETLDNVIRRVFETRDAEEQELIVRVPHMLAKYSELHDEEGTSPTTEGGCGEERLKQQVPDLLNFFSDVVIPDMEEYLKSCPPAKDRDEITKENLRLHTATKLESTGVTFKDTYDLKDKQLHVLSSPNVAFYEIMINEAARCKGESYLFLRMSQWDSSVKDVLTKYKCSLIVLSSEKESYRKLGQEAQEGLPEFLDVLSKDRETRVIVLTQDAEHDEFVTRLKQQESFKPQNVYVDTMSDSGFGLVTEECKMNILKRSDISFQDSKTELNVSAMSKENADEFFKSLDETTFLTLCLERKLQVGPQLQQLDDDLLKYYIERTCKRATEVDLRAAFLQNCNEAFAIVGCSKEHLTAFLPHGYQARHHKRVERFEKCVLLDGENDYDALTRSKSYEGKTIHLLRHDTQSLDTRLDWVRSNGPVSRLPKVMFTAREIRDTETLLGESPDKVLAICGEPGMGKSVMSLRMAEDIKAKEDIKEITCVVHVDLHARLGREELGAMKDLSEIAVLARLCHVREGTFHFNLLQKSIISAKPFKVVVIFDAFDEVDTTRRKFALDQVIALRATKIWKVILFSRKICRSEIEDALHTVAYDLVGFNEEQQKRFREKFWKRGGREINDETLDSFQHEALSCFHSQGKDMVTKNPLLIKMQAEIIEKSANFDIENLRAVKPVQEAKCTIFYIYENFVKMKVMCYLTKTFRDLNLGSIAVQQQLKDTEEKLYENHRLLGLSVLLDGESLSILLTEQELEKLKPEGSLMQDEKEGRLKQGFVDGYSTGAPVFVHKTFAEFFAAYFLAEKVAAKNPNDDVLRFISGMYGNKDYSGIVTFLDAIGAKSNGLHRHIMNLDWQSAEKTLKQDYDRDAFGRTPLHITALYADEKTLLIVDNALGKEMANELLAEDKLRMTPLMYADRLCAWDRLGAFWVRCREAHISLAKQVPRAIENIKHEREFKRSVLHDAILMIFKELLLFLLKESCIVKGTDELLLTDLQNMRLGEPTEQPGVVDVDTIKCSCGYTPVFHAMTYDIFKILLPFSDIGAVGTDGSNLFHVCAALGIKDTLRHRLCRLQGDLPNNVGQRPLHVSSINGQREIACILLPHQTSRDVRDNYGNTPLHLAAKLALCLEQKPRSICSFLNTLQRRTVVDGGQRPPQRITSDVKADALKEILPHVDATICNRHGDTALQGSVYDVSWDTVVRLLPFSDVDAININGQTPLLSSVSTEPSRSAGTDKLEIKALKLLILHSDVNICDEHSRNALHLCAFHGRTNALKLLIPHLSAKKLDKTGKTPLHWAVVMGTFDVVKCLIPNSSVNAKDCLGRTPLSWSACFAHIDNVRALLPFSSINSPDTNASSKMRPDQESQTDITQHFFLRAPEREEEEEKSVRRRKRESSRNKFFLSQEENCRPGQESQTDITQHFFLRAPEREEKSVRRRKRESSRNKFFLSQEENCCPGQESHTDITLHFFLRAPEREEEEEKLVRRRKRESSRNKCFPSQEENCRPSQLEGRTFFRELDREETFLRNWRILNIHSRIPAIYIFDAEKHLPMHECAVGGDTDMVEFLLPHSSAWRTNKYGSTVLHLIMDHGCIGVMLVILPHSNTDSRDCHGDTALHASVHLGLEKVVNQLLPYSDVDATNKAGLTVLARSLYMLPPWVEDLTTMRIVTIQGCKRIQMMRLLVLHSGVNIADRGNRTAVELRASYVGELDVIKLIFPHLSVNTTGKGGVTFLHCAAGRGELDAVKYLHHKSRINARDEDGNTPLMFSVCFGHVDIVRLLLPLTQINIPNVEGSTPLHYCAKEGRVHIAEFLLPHSSACIKDRRGCNPLRVSAECGRVDTTRVILPHSDAVMGDPTGDTALHRSAYFRCLDAVKLLLPYSQVNVTNESGMRALTFSICEGDRRLESEVECTTEGIKKHSVTTTHEMKMIKLLLLHSSVNIVDREDRKAPELHASFRRQLDVIKLIIPHSSIHTTDKVGQTFLHYAAQYGQLDAVKYFLYKSRINARNEKGDRPLMSSAYFGRMDIVRLLLPLTQINIPNVEGSIPLHYSARECQAHTTELLLPHSSAYRKDRRGANPLHVSAECGRVDTTRVILPHSNAVLGDHTTGGTALHRSAYSRCLDAVILLLPYSQVNATNKSGKRALTFSICEGDRRLESEEECTTEGMKNSVTTTHEMKMIKLLLLHSSVNIVDREDRNALELHASFRRQLDVIKLIFPHFSVNTTGNGGVTFLHYAAGYGRLDAVKYFLYKSRINARNGKGDTPLMFSAQVGHMDIVRLLLPLTQINIPNVEGFTPLHYCAKEGQAHIAEFLLPHSSACIKDRRGCNPLRVSAECGRVDTTRVILPHSDAVMGDPTGDTALHRSAYLRCLDAVKLLLPYSQVNVTNESGMRAVTFSICEGDRRLESEEECTIEGIGEKSATATHEMKMIKLLLLHSSVNIVDREDRNALELHASFR